MTCNTATSFQVLRIWHRLVFVQYGVLKNPSPWLCIDESREISMETLEDTFTAFFERSEPKLRNALVAAYGLEVGTEAASDALAHGWEHWERVRVMDNPAGYLYRGGQSKSRRVRRRPPMPRGMRWQG